MREQKANYEDDLAMSAARKTRERDYWLEQLAGELEKTAFPPDSLNRTNDKSARKQEKIKMGKDLFSSIMKLCKGSDYTLFVILMSGLVLLIYKYTGMKDIILGAPIFKQKITGNFLNTVLPLRYRLHGDMTFKQLLLQARQTLQEAVAHQNYPMDVLLYHLKLQENGDGFPLFDMAVLLENIHDPGYLKGVNLNMVFNFLRSEEHIDISIEYDARTFNKTTIQRIGNHLIDTLAVALADVQLPVGTINILSTEEKKQLLVEFNDTRKEFSQDRTAAGFIVDQAKKNPDRPALRCEGQEISYKQLHNNACRLAEELRKKGVKKDCSVGILSNRSIAMVESILAVWYASGAYIPISPETPPERIRIVLEDSRAAVLITAKTIPFSIETEMAGSPFVPKLIPLDESGSGFQPAATNEIEPAGGPHDLAYIIFTSGSTGKPKGAMVEQIGMMNHLDAKAGTLAINAKSIVAQNASHTFDISVWQFFTALMHGGKTVIYPNDIVLEPDRFIDRIIEDKVTILEVVPSYLSVMLDSLESEFKTLDTLKYLLVTGEEVKFKQVERWFGRYPKIKMVNAYGPTEASDDITHSVMERVPNRQRIPIGKPIQNFNIYILDDDMNLCPVGVKGELFVSGIGVGRGYLNNPQLTAEKFLTRKNNGCFLKLHSRNTFKNLINRHNPSTRSSHSILYRTGDIACWQPDGNIEFFGRKDNQVKIRGYRIELEEIEARILEHPKVNEAAVVLVKAKEGIQKDIYAFFTARETENNNIPGIGDIQEYLAAKLPGYMLPSQIINLEKLPLTLNGKINRKTLERMGEELDLSVEFTPPSTETEKILGKIWQEVLKLEKVSIHDIFFQLGGNSLTAISVASALKKAGFEVSLVDIINHPTIDGLARVIQKRNNSNEPEQDINEIKRLGNLECIEKLNRGHGNKKIFILHPMHGMVNLYKELAVLLEEEFNVYGVQARGMAPGTEMPENPGQMIDDYLEQILTLQEQGPFVLAGYCVGTAIAYELARRLEKLKHPVEKLILFDPLLMFPENLVRIYRALEYLPGFVKGIIHWVYNRKFEKTIKTVRPEHLSGDRSNREQIENYIKVLGDHVLPLEFIKAPILIFQAENGPYIHLSENQFRKFTRGETTVIKTPGDHNSIWEKPHVEKMAEALIDNL